MHATLTDVIADTAQNSIEAGASRVSVSLTEDKFFISVTITDNGKGMDAATRARAFDPFWSEPGKHDKRRVGLGLPILRQLCEATGGDVKLESECGKGTHLAYRFSAQHVDLPPMGDIPEMLMTLFNYPGDFDLIFSHVRGGEKYEIARSELVEAVGGLEDASSLALAREFLLSQEEALPKLAH